MFFYYLRLAVISIRKNPVLSTLMVTAIGLGIGACMTVLTVNYLMSSDPIPQKSDVLYYVQLDNWDPNNAADGSNEPPDQLTYLDATALLKANQAFRQTANAATSLVIEPPGDDAKPFLVSGRGSFSSFFAMFDVPFLYGGPWDRDADDAEEQVVVLTREINDRVFGGEDSVGRNLRMAGFEFRVVGVMDTWLPMPKFYDVSTGPFDDVEEVFFPFNLIVPLELSRNGNTNCWKSPDGDGIQAFLNSECVWIQYWAELPTVEARQDYLAHLDNYVSEQKTLGRFERPLNNRISNVTEWMEIQQVVLDDAKIVLALAVMFLVVCILNTIGLLLSKFLGKAPEIGLRRALGASKRTLLVQHLIETACIGLVGGLLGLVLTWFGLRGIEALYGGISKELVSLDWVMIASAVALALVSSVAAGLYPTWRACSVAPAAQLKSQ
ncbi:MAG: ABC transporter permease [Gammaproteobacteria bacterium]|nr:ABC transporter permease [Gammaproteobacteria bacterium]